MHYVPVITGAAIKCYNKNKGDLTTYASKKYIANKINKQINK